MIYSDNLNLRNKELADNVARMEAELAQSRNRYEATVKSQAARIEDLNESNNIAQLLIANYKANEDEEADVERRLSKRFDRERRQYDSQVEDLSQRNEDLRLLLAEVKKKYERMLRERNQSNADAMEAEMGAMRQWGEVTARDGTIAKLKEQHEKVTADSIKKATTMRSQEVTIEDLKGQRTGLRNKVDEVEVIVEARDSEIGTLKALIDIRNDEINGLEET